MCGTRGLGIVLDQEAPAGRMESGPQLQDDPGVEIEVSGAKFGEFTQRSPVSIAVFAHSRHRSLPSAANTASNSPGVKM